MTPRVLYVLVPISVAMAGMEQSTAQAEPTSSLDAIAKAEGSEYVTLRDDWIDSGSELPAEGVAKTWQRTLLHAILEARIRKPAVFRRWDWPLPRTITGEPNYRNAHVVGAISLNEDDRSEARLFIIEQIWKGLWPAETRAYVWPPVPGPKHIWPEIATSETEVGLQAIAFLVVAGDPARAALVERTLADDATPKEVRLAVYQGLLQLPETKENSVPARFENQVASRFAEVSPTERAGRLVANDLHHWVGDRELGAAAVGLLAAAPGREARNLLHRIVESAEIRLDPNEEAAAVPSGVRVAALNWMAKASRPSDAEVLQSAVRSGDVELRLTAAWQLRAYGRAVALPIVRGTLARSTDAYQLVITLETLSEIGMADDAELVRTLEARNDVPKDARLTKAIVDVARKLAAKPASRDGED